MKKNVLVFAISAALVAAAVIHCGCNGITDRPRDTIDAQAVGKSAPWGSSRGDERNSGCSSYKGPCGTAAWEYRRKTEADWCSGPVVGMGNVYVVWRDPWTLTACAIDASTGEEKWSIPLPDPIGTQPGRIPSPAVGRNRSVYLVSPDAALWAVDPQSGKERWSFQTSAAIMTSPTVGITNTVYFGCVDGAVYAVNGDTGKQVWRFSTKGPAASSPAVLSNGLVCFGTGATTRGRKGFVYAVDVDSGEEVWKYECGPVITLVCAGKDGMVYATTQDLEANLLALDSRNGKKKWDFSVGHLSSAPAVGPDGTVYVQNEFGQHGKLHAIDPASGAKKWSFDYATGGASPVVSADGTVYVYSCPKLMALDGRTGPVKWRLNRGFGGVGATSPALGPDGTMYVTAYGGRLIAVR